MSLSVAGKTAIVTGAAKGIGLAIAWHLVDRGARVMFADADEERLVTEVGEAAEKEGAVRYFAGDLCKKLTVANLLSATVEAFDRIDVVVNSGRQIQPSDPLNPEDESLEAMLRHNLLTPLRVCQMAARRMIAQAERDGQEEGPVGTLINISTIAARRAQSDLLAYSVAGAAIDQATRSLAVALAPHRIRVNAVAFGSVMSASLQNSLKDHPDWRKRITDGTPMGRIAAPNELAEVVQFLASDGSGFMTGQVLTVDGGRSLIDPVDAPAH